MQLAFCLFKYFPYGGLERDFMRFLQEAIARGHQCRVYCIKWQGQIPDGVDVRFVPIKALSNHRRNEKFAAYANDDIKRDPVDVVFGFNKMPGLDVYYAADSCYEDKAQKNRSWLYRLGARYRHFSKAEQSIFNRGQKTDILLISETEKNKFIEHYDTEPDRMFMLPPGISRDRCAPDNSTEIRADFRCEFNLDDDDKLMLFIGSGFIKKGLDRVIKSLASLPAEKLAKTQLYILGQDKEKNYRALAKKLNVADKVKFFNGRDDVPRFLLAADILVHPALDEAAGIVLLEAVVAGLPVLVTDVCGYAPHIDKADCGVVLSTPFSQQNLNQQLLAIYNDELMGRWRKNALSYAKNADLYSMHATGIDCVERCFNRLHQSGDER
ncbi:glycosyltransferase family 4 protein [Oceanicoccus sp. KOV_DT_Chl]|uniref:glycosyltransferase family 4 protein n=1 Tax=Oceanicoccus sp. KOV_DT_Chl TaxID=1904639 RepID=UPI000C7B7364|nr:glycosyltransferase family 4 protein [Oceanicoccus sp. KOV_DT_Chl]